jgi:hypothetical protein
LVAYYSINRIAAGGSAFGLDPLVNVLANGAQQFVFGEWFGQVLV